MKLQESFFSPHGTEKVAIPLWNYRNCLIQLDRITLVFDTGLAIGGNGSVELSEESEEPEGIFLFGLSVVGVSDGNGIDLRLLRDLGLMLTESSDCGMTMAALVANPDFRCITPAERAMIINWPQFDITLENENGNSFIFLNSQTGDYQFTTCGFAGVSLSGTGKVTRKGCLLTIEDVRPDRRVIIKINTCGKTGSAGIQILPQGKTYTLIDKNTTNNLFNCPEALNGL